VAVLMGYFIGYKVNFLRCDTDPTETVQPAFMLKTGQFTLTIVFTMIANTSQGQIFKDAGIYLIFFLPSHVLEIVTTSKLSSNNKSRFNFK
jgi:hypothetical protein